MDMGGRWTKGGVRRLGHISTLTHEVVDELPLKDEHLGHGHAGLSDWRLWEQVYSWKRNPLPRDYKGDSGRKKQIK